MLLQLIPYALGLLKVPTMVVELLNILKRRRELVGYGGLMVLRLDRGWYLDPEEGNEDIDSIGVELLIDCVCSP